MQRFYDRTGMSSKEKDNRFSPALLYIGRMDLTVLVFKPSVETKQSYRGATVSHVSNLDRISSQEYLANISAMLYHDGQLHVNPRLKIRGRPLWSEFTYPVGRTFGKLHGSKIGIWYYEFYTRIIHGIREPISGKPA